MRYKTLNPEEPIPSSSRARPALARRKSPTVPFFYPDWLILREIATHVQRCLGGVGCGKLLDLGCGDRPYQIYAPPTLTAWIGLDVPGNPTADAHGSAESLPFGNESFDVILCTEVLEHLSEPSAAVAEMARVLRPGGHVILSTPLYFPIHEEPYDFFRYTPYGLQYLFEKAGFEILTLKPLATGLRLVAIAINTSFNDFGKELPGGRTWLGRAIFAPVYAATNLFAHAASRLLPAPKNAVGHALLARKRLKAGAGRPG